MGIDLGSNERKLTSQELSIGKRVFKNTIKWDQVRITDGHCLQGSPCTNAGIGQDTMHLTAKYFSNPPADLLVHELTHVWQGTNGGITGWGYKLNSIINQGISDLVGSRNGAYKYDPRILGRIGWGMLGAEVQAQIVEDWFVRGEKRNDPAFRYIHWCIRKLFFCGWFPPPAP